MSWKHEKLLIIISDCHSVPLPIKVAAEDLSIGFSILDGAPNFLTLSTSLILQPHLPPAPLAAANPLALQQVRQSNE